MSKELVAKIDELAALNDRSRSKMIEILLRDEIDSALAEDQAPYNKPIKPNGGAQKAS